MDFNTKFPTWAEGTEPSDEIKATGFQPGYKPPAAFFNWFWNLMLEGVSELQEKLSLTDEQVEALKKAGTSKHASAHSEGGADPISPYNIRAVDAMMGIINGATYTFDTALKQGEYNVQAADTAGAPYAGTLYGKLIVTLSDGKEKNDANWIWQEFLPASASKQRCWRMKINTGDWTDWFAYYDAGHKPTLTELGAAADNHKHPYAINIGYDRIDINEGEDLNNILDMGCYRCATASKAATLLNSPTQNAFILDMVAATGGNIAINPDSYTYGTQRLYDLDGNHYVRRVTSNADGTITYGEWIAMYSTGNKPTPEEIGALALSGGVMTGQGFYINNKTGRIVGNQNGLWLRTASSDVDNNEDSRHLKIWNATYVTELVRALCLFDTKTGKDYLVYGQHNVTSGTADLTAGQSSLATGAIHLVYE